MYSLFCKTASQVAHTWEPDGLLQAMHTDQTDRLVQCGWGLGQAVWLWCVRDLRGCLSVHVVSVACGAGCLSVERA